MSLAGTGNRDINPDEEESLMRRIADGDGDAYRLVMGTYMTDIYRFAYSIVGDAARAEDVTQETALRLWTKAARWNPPGRIKSWLFTIAHRLCVDELRRHRKQLVPLDDIAGFTSDAGETPHQALAGKQSSAIIKNALLRLPERQRTALMLVHYSDFSNGEAASIMKVSVDALESLLSRGRRELKFTLAGSRKNLLDG
jgi:RNA polymerase sigma-70 factor (ECF subfamily)